MKDEKSNLPEKNGIKEITDKEFLGQIDTPEFFQTVGDPVIVRMDTGRRVLCGSVELMGKTLEIMGRKPDASLS